MKTAVEYRLTPAGCETRLVNPHKDCPHYKYCVMNYPDCFWIWKEHKEMFK